MLSRVQPENEAATDTKKTGRLSSLSSRLPQQHNKKIESRPDLSHLLLTGAWADSKATPVTSALIRDTTSVHWG